MSTNRVVCSHIYVIKSIRFLHACINLRKKKHCILLSSVSVNDLTVRAVRSDAKLGDRARAKRA